MHKIEIPQHIVESVIKRRGTLHQYREIVGKRSALIVVDLQNAFMQEGMPAEIPAARDLVGNVNRLATSVRKLGGVVAWVRMTIDEESRTRWSTYFDGLSPERGTAMVEHLRPGVPGHTLYDGLDVHAEDVTFDKYRYSAFQPFPTELAAKLALRSIENVLICGTLTNTCCESTARDAMSLNYRTVLIADGMATRSDAEHNATLASMLLGFGDVCLTDEAISRLI